MRRKRLVEIERFDIVDDTDGYETTIVVLQTETDASSMDGYHPPIRSRLKDYRTIDGHHVNVKGDDEFEVLGGIDTRTMRRVEQEKGRP